MPPTPPDQDATLRQQSYAGEAPSLPPEFGLPPGTRFGRYHLLRQIGQGGMGAVYEARHESLDRVVALKILHTLQQRPEDIERFANEARAVARLVHPGIVRIHDVGEVGGRHYLACELIKGHSLDRVIAQDPPSPERAMELIAGLAEAVDYAHQKGVIHRDLKPSNVLIDERGQPWLTDFGLARRTDGGERLTKTGQALGTPAYMAPEQISNERGSIGQPTDVHGLGAILYELLTGQPPFRGENLFNTLHQVLNVLPREPHQVNPRVPVDYSRVCMRCLAKRPQDRYPTAKSLAEACAQLGGPVAPDTELFAPEVSRRRTRQSGRPPRPAVRRTRRRLLAGLALAGALLLGGGLGAWIQSRRQPAAKGASPTMAAAPARQQYVSALLRGDSRAAFGHLTRHVAEHPQDLELRRKRVELARELKRIDEAVSDLRAIEAAGKLNEGEADALLGHYLGRRSIAEATRLVDRAFEGRLNSGPGLALRVADHLERKKQFERAIGLLERAIERAPDDAKRKLWKRIARLRLATGHVLEAARALVKGPPALEDTDPAETRSLLLALRPVLQAKLARGLVDRTLAADQWKLLLSLAERDPRFYLYQLAQAREHFRQRDEKAARKALLEATEADGTPPPEVSHAIAESCLRAGEPMWAARMLLKIPRDADPARTGKLVEALRGRMQIVGMQHDLKVAESSELDKLREQFGLSGVSTPVFRQVLCGLAERDPEFYYYQIAVGWKHYLAGDAERGLAAFDRARALLKNNSALLVKEIYRGRLYCHKKLKQHRAVLADSRWLLEALDVGRGEYREFLRARYEAQVALKQTERARRTMTLMRWVVGYLLSSEKAALQSLGGSDREATPAEMLASYQMMAEVDDDAGPLRASDLILRYAGSPVTTGDGLTALKRKPPEKTVELELERRGKRIALRLAPAEWKALAVKLSWDRRLRILEKD